MDADSALARIPTWIFVVLVPVIAGLAILVTAPLSGSGGSAAARSLPAEDTVVIRNYSFEPKRITARVGQPVTVVNEDAVTHTFTADRRGFDTGDLGSGRRAHITVARAGTYPYHCQIHPFMKGTVEVSP